MIEAKKRFIEEGDALTFHKILQKVTQDDIKKADELFKKIIN